MTDHIDYSRPVGWWCAYCEEDGPCTRTVNLMGWCCDRIPRYLPIPEGQRPLVEDEVATGEAEVVTVGIGGIIDWLNNAGTRWTTDPTVEHINYIVTGATE